MVLCYQQCILLGEWYTVNEYCMSAAFDTEWGKVKLIMQRSAMVTFLKILIVFYFYFLSNINIKTLLATEVNRIFGMIFNGS